jgi:REP element-mobilizing transposase RayT
MPQSYTCLQYHLIFSTRDRVPAIAAPMRPRLYDYFGGILREQRGVLIAAGGTADHVHLLAGISKEQAVSAALRVIKANSSRWMHETFPELHRFGWQAGYGAFTIGYSGVANVKQYIERQEEHHRTVTFQEEFLEFLRRYNVPYDERYIWA